MKNEKLKIISAVDVYKWKLDLCLRLGAMTVLHITSPRAKNMTNDKKLKQK